MGKKIIKSYKSSLTLRLADINDIRTIYEWRNNKTIVDLSLSGLTVDWKEHSSWFQKALVSNDIVLFVIQIINSNGKAIEIGEIRFDRLSNNTAEVTIFIMPEYEGFGYGAVALDRGCHQMFSEWPEITNMRAKILHKNAKSKGLFRKVKFVEDIQNENYIEMVLYNG